MRLRTIAITIATASLVTGVSSQGTSTKAETGLVGVKLYDSGLKLVNVFGNPNEIQVVTIGGGGGAGIGAGRGAGAGMNRSGFGGPPAGIGIPGGVPGGFGGPPAGIPGVPGSTGGKKGPMGAAADMGPGFGDAILQQSGLSQGDRLRQDAEGSSIPGGGMGGPPGGIPGFGGMGRAGGGMGGPGAAMGGGGGAVEPAEFTRWVYNRSGSRYGFIVNKQNQIVQIEAVGLTDPKVNTRRNVRFGATFASVLKKHGDPDGYEISSDTIIVRYLKNDKVAFRFNKLKRDGAFQVTGVVVSAGKV
ncbi:MAG: hypothetical protein KIS66_12085 [Fimbriimonadaceae bacterium]|nr:hypothetical protein [Fimbriimonadaceae bacterium]